MATQAQNITATPQALPALYGGATVAPGASAVIADAQLAVMANFAAAGLATAGVWVFTTAAQPLALSTPTYTVYVSATGNASASGLDPNNPTTLLAALSLATSDVVLNVVAAAGTYAWPLPNNFVFPSGSIVNLIGTYVDAGLGALTTNAVNSGITVSTGTTLVANAYRGYRIRFTSGAMAGRYFTIQSNTTSAVLVAGTLNPWSFASGDGFVIEKAGTVIQVTGSFNHVIHGATVTLKAVRVTAVGSANFLTWCGLGRLFWEGVEIDGSSFTMQMPIQAGVQAVLGTFNSGAGLASEHGCYFHGILNSNSGLSIQNSSKVRIFNLVEDNCVHACYYDVEIYINGIFATNSTWHVLSRGHFVVSFVYDSSATSFNTMSGRNTFFNGGIIDLTVGSVGDVEYGSFGGSSASAFLVESGSFLYLFAGASATTGVVGGTINTTYGVQCVQGGQVQIHGTPTVTGSTGDLLLGGNAAPTTWANVASAPRNDTAAGTPQNCWAQAGTT